MLPTRPPHPSRASTRPTARCRCAETRQLSLIVGCGLCLRSVWDRLVGTDRPSVLSPVMPGRSCWHRFRRSVLRPVDGRGSRISRTPRAAGRRFSPPRPTTPSRPEQSSRSPTGSSRLGTRRKLSWAALSVGQQRRLRALADRNRPGQGPLTCQEMAASFGLDPVPAKVEALRSRAKRLTSVRWRWRVLRGATGRVPAAPGPASPRRARPRPRPTAGAAAARRSR